MNELKIKRQSYFPTLVYRATIENPENLNKDLVQAIYKDRLEDQEGITRSNIRALGGWHSKINLHKEPEYEPLVTYVDNVSAKMCDELGYSGKHRLNIGSMWSIINPPGSANVAHIHPGCQWSGVYYVHAPENAGKIAFTDPRTENLMNQPKYIPKKTRPQQCWTKVNIKPEAGKMLIFPSWLYHSVAPNLSQEEGEKADRVIISFNLNQRKK